MRCNTTIFSGHAITRMFDRGLTKIDVMSTIQNGEFIFDYPDDNPYPSRLMLAIIKATPIHVVVARNKKDYACYVITAYIPSTEIWLNDFKTRKM